MIETGRAIAAILGKEYVSVVPTCREYYKHPHSQNRDNEELFVSTPYHLRIHYEAIFGFKKAGVKLGITVLSRTGCNETK